MKMKYYFPKDGFLRHFVHLIIAVVIHLPLISFSNEKPLMGTQGEDLIMQLKTKLASNQLNAAAKLLLKVDWEAIPKSTRDDLLKNTIDLSEKYHSKGDPDSSYLFSEFADSLINRFDLKNKTLQCELTYLKAWYFYKNSEISNSRSEFEKALHICENGVNDSLRALILKYLGNIDFINGELKNALAFYRESLSIELIITKPADIIISALYQNIGIVHASFGKYDSARFYIRKSVLMKENIMDETDPRLANGYLNYSLFLWQTGELQGALDYINKAENIYRKNYGTDYYALAPLYVNKGSILFTLKDSKEALSYYNLALELNKKFKHPNVHEFLLYSNIAAVYGYMGNLPKAIEYQKIALDSEPDLEDEISIQMNLADNYLRSSDTMEARKFFKQGISKAEMLNADSSPKIPSAFMTYGKYCDVVGSFDTSLIYLNKAYALYRRLYGTKNRKVCEALTLLSLHYSKIKDYRNALEFAQHALIAGLKGFNDTSIYQNPGHNNLVIDFAVYSALARKAMAFRSYDQHDGKDEVTMKAIIETAELAVYVLERIKSSVKGEEAKLLVSFKSHERYDLVVEMAAGLYEKTGKFEYLQKSFEYSEKGKAAILLANIREGKALQVGGVPKEIRTLESDLKMGLAQLQHVIFEENKKISPDTNKLAMYRLVRYKKRMMYDSLTDALEKNYPDYYNLKYNLNVTDISAIQAKLMEDEAFIEYKLTDSTLFSFIISRDTNILIQKNIDHKFRDQLGQFISLINHIPEVEHVKQNSLLFAELGYEVFTKLNLDHPILSDKKRLIIIPDDLIAYLSFDALVCLPADTTYSNYSKLNYLVQSHALSYGYSGTLYFSNFKKGLAADQLLAMAPDYEFTSNTLANIDEPGIRELSQGLRPLKFTGEEVKKINAVFPGKILVGQQATESNFKAACDQYKILHFAMHAFLNDEDPLSSKLIFSLAKKDSIEDGFLNTYEIYNLDFNAELAVLSACNTGVGKYSKGEGVMSLARGFLYAGVPSIVMTLWSIEDRSSANIISRFYTYLKKGEKKDVALQNAKLEYLNSANQLQAHPYFWAAFVQIGDTSALSTSLSNVYYGMGLSFLFVILIVYLLRKRRVRQ